MLATAAALITRMHINKRQILQDSSTLLIFDDNKHEVHEVTIG